MQVEVARSSSCAALADMTAPLLATYRVQLHGDSPAAAAERRLLAALGISYLYSSPCLQAVRGSTHGYDVVDPQRLSTDLGGATEHARMVAALRACGSAPAGRGAEPHGDRCRQRW
jgi:maltooligosyltrehalose synthase